ncbi:MAG: helix-turn-helix domain-containing protein [Phycisphaerae bacterium]|nr:helix-turn-helix domain-containing protein [Gemmatimonadaceae bacterium]
MSDTLNVTNAANDVNAAEPAAPPDLVKVRADVMASNAPDTVNPASAAEVAAPVQVGALLREGREKLKLSAGDIATKLRMGVKQVTALENADYAALPTGTFLRGFVRNYARMVSLNADEVLALLEKNNSAAVAIRATPVVVPSQQNIKVPAPGGELATPNGRAIVVGVVILLLLAAVWYWWVHVFPYRSEGGRVRASATQSIAVPQPAVTAESPPQPVQLPSADSVPAVSPTGIGAGDKTVAIATPPVAPVVAGPVAIPVAEKPRAPARPAVVPAGNAALGFTFSGESWVEVIDGTGKTVVSRRFTAGDAEEVIGRAPFSVVIGNASLTRMAFNGRELDLEPHTRGAVARMTLK